MKYKVLSIVSHRSLFMQSTSVSVHQVVLEFDSLDEAEIAFRLLGDTRTSQGPDMKTIRLYDLDCG